LQLKEVFNINAYRESIHNESKAIYQNYRKVNNKQKSTHSFFFKTTKSAREGKA